MNGTFEDKLLGELKQVIAERAAEPEPRRAWRPKLVVAGGIAAALGLIAALGIPVLTADETSSAWAVTRTADGWVRVEIHEYRDAEGLERKLEDMGIRAEIDFMPFDQTCKKPRFEQGGPSEKALRLVEDGEGAIGEEFLARPSALGPDDTVVAEISGTDDDSGSYRGFFFAVATGPVAPCELVPEERPRVMLGEPTTGTRQSEDQNER